MNHNILQLKQLLKKITLEEIILRIEKFKLLDFQTISDNKLSEEIQKVLEIENGFILLPRFSSYPTKTKFYRVRKLKPDDHHLPLHAMTYEKDAWNPPETSITKLGRLNKVGESLLYTSPISPQVAVEEMNIKDNERFCLIIYQSLAEIKVSIIGEWKDLIELDKEENLKMRVRSNFLKDEFSRDVGQWTEFLYRVSERITKDYFDLPPRDIQDAWCYPSIASKASFNVCFRPELAKELLKLLGVQICEVKKEWSNYLFKVIGILADFDEDDQFIFHKVNSLKCLELFPEIWIQS